MDKHSFSPYIRNAKDSALIAPFKIAFRTLFDYELIFVSEGICKITMNNTEYLCKKNNAIFIRPGVTHKFECVDNVDFVQPHIHFDVSYDNKSKERIVSFKRKDKMSDYELSLIQDDAFKDIAVPFVFVPHDINKFRKLFFEIIDIWQHKKYNYQLHYKAKMLELIDLILIQFDNEKRTPNRHISVIDIKNYIDNNYMSHITLDSLAMQFHFNKYTMLRNFKSSYNQNIIEYYHSKRIEYIKKTLKTTSVPISLISEKMNFSDVYSFSRFFKSHTGYSPVAYRKNKQEATAHVNE